MTIHKQIPVVGTLVYIRRTVGDVQEIVLAKKGRTKSALKRGLADKRNSYGGGLEQTDESLPHCGAREVLEESGVIIDPNSLKKIAVLLFRNPWGDYKCHCFVVDKNDANPRATLEMLDPQWFSVQGLPFTEMLESDELFLPQLLAHDPSKRELLLGEVWHDEKMNITKHTVVPVTVLP